MYSKMHRQFSRICRFRKALQRQIKPGNFYQRSLCVDTPGACAIADAVVAKALYMLLRSTLGNQLLTSTVVGTTTPLIELRALMLDAKSQAQTPSMFDSKQSIREEIYRQREEQAALPEDFWEFAEEDSSC